MSEAAIAQTIVTASLLVIFAGLFIWGWKTGQFNDENIKYIIFRRPPQSDDKEDRKGGEDK